MNFENIIVYTIVLFHVQSNFLNSGFNFKDWDITYSTHWNPLMVWNDSVEKVNILPLLSW